MSFLIGTFICICVMTVCQVHSEVERNSLERFNIAQQELETESNTIDMPEKRSTMLLDRLVYALQKALKQETEQVSGMELQRRRPGGRVYWRCYFNAVSCFRRK